MIHSEEGTSLCDIKYKIVFLGDMSVGKSSIIERFINGCFDQKHQQTVGIDFLAKNVTYNDHLYRLQLWDTAGQEKFRSLIPAYLRDAHCAVMVFDIANPRTFESIESWIKLFNDYRRTDAIVVLVGNKLDLREERKVTHEKAHDLASRNHIGYCQVSAKKGDGIELLFQSIIDNIQVYRYTDGEEEVRTIEEPPLEGSGSQQKINKKAIVSVAALKKSRLACCSI